MAKLQLTFHDVECAKGPDTGSQKHDIVVSTERDTDMIYVQHAGQTAMTGYGLQLLNVRFEKKMYQPTAITAQLQITLLAGDTTDMLYISKAGLAELFQNKKVSLVATNEVDSKEVTMEVGSDFYVEDLLPHYKRDAMQVKMRIFSPDYLLTKEKGCKAFVAKKLADGILSEELKNYKLPYSDDTIAYDADHMQILAYDYKADKRSEHIFPYLVQYNESFYDMLKRTANRWGEFLYWEDGKLNVGYDDTQAPADANDWYAFDYINLAEPLTNIPGKEMGTYDPEAAEDSTIALSQLQKSPDKLKNLPQCSMEDGKDVWLMKLIASYFDNTDSIPTYLGNVAFDEAFEQAVALKNKQTVDDDFNENYFQDQEVEEQYGIAKFDGEDKEAFNQFTELNTPYKKEKYVEILNKEQLAGQDAIRLNYDTTYPNLKLGQIIHIKQTQQDCIVVNVECLTVACEKAENEQTEKTIFQVTAIPKIQDEKVFYPSMLPSGHIRKTGPQLATVFDANDPLNQNRVRIHFPWQKVTDENGEYLPGAEEVASPWLVYATSAASKSNGIFGKHYQGDDVIVNFNNNNMESPYVVGGLALKGNKVPGSLAERDIVLSSPGGHTLRMDDGSAAGLTAFLAGAVFPGYEMLTTFLPPTAGFDLMEQWGADPKVSRNFEGGFQLTDKYGIYTISGSTDGRNVSVKSPWGDVAINAFTGIKIEAPNGDIEITGKNIKIEAGNNLELISGANVENKLGKLKDTVMGTIGANTGDMALAVAKKLAENFQVLDMSFIRSMVEVVMRPVEGALTVKSNRFLKLEAGKGECDYPADAYKDSAQRKLQAKEEKKILKGVKMQAGMKELVIKTGALAAEVDRRYKKLYNKCYEKLKGDGGYEKAIEEAIKQADNFSSSRASTTICKSFDDLLDKMWDKNLKSLKAADLEFKDNYKFEAADVSDGCAAAYLLANPNTTLTAAQAKEIIAKKRKKHRDTILKAANKLHKAISELQNVEALNGADITSVVGRFWITNVPENYKDALKDAFDPDKLKVDGNQEVFYYQPVEGDRKKFSSKYQENDLATEKKVLARKAAILLLEGLGFDDEWRGRTAERPFKAADIVTNKWETYVDSIKNAPPLKPLEWEITGIGKDFLKGIIDFDNWKDMVKLFSQDGEVRAWSDNNEGGILFASGEQTFKLGENIAKVEGATDGNLSDDNEKVRNFLTKLKEELKKL